MNKFVFEADPPNTARIPATEILGVTVILLSCSYDDREFVRVGYYVNNEYTDEALANEPPAKPVVDKVRRSILAEKPRVTRFNIKWDSDETAPAEFPPEQPDVDAQEDDGAAYGAEDEEDEEDDEEAPELANGEAPATAKVVDEDAEMDGVEAAGKEDDEESEAGSEDIGDESEEEEDDEELEDDGEEPQGDHEMDMDGPAPIGKEDGDKGQVATHQPDVMVH